jgi:hypothetical protein
MYGVPKDINLNPFLGATLVQIRIGQHDIQFCFHPNVLLAVEGTWQLCDDTGNVIDHSLGNEQLPSEREVFRVHVLLGQDVDFGTFGHPWESTICVWAQQFL